MISNSCVYPSVYRKGLKIIEIEMEILIFDNRYPFDPYNIWLL